MTLQKNCLFKTSKNKVNKQDYLFALLASIISACGFALNSETVVIGSMLISPLLKPMVNLAVSIAKWKPKVIAISLGHSLSMLLGTTLIGAFIGFIFYKFFPRLQKTFDTALEEEDNNNVSAEANTILGRVGSLMQSEKGLVYIAIIAIAGGILLARTHCTDYSDLTTAVIGTGISTSILPPIIAGSMMLTVENKYNWKKFINGITLSAINIILIFTAYIATLYFTW